MHRLCGVKRSEAASLILSRASSMRAECPLETPVANVELFQVDEKKPDLLAAHAAGSVRVRGQNCGLLREGAKATPGGRWPRAQLARAAARPGPRAVSRQARRSLICSTARASRRCCRRATGCTSKPWNRSATERGPIQYRSMRCGRYACWQHLGMESMSLCITHVHVHAHVHACAYF